MSLMRYERENNIKDEAPGPGVNEPAIFAGADGLIIFDGEPLARRVESSVEIGLDWDEVYFQGQYTVGALVLKSIKLTGGIKQATANLNILKKFIGMSPADGTREDATIRDVRYVAPVDIILILDKSMLPPTIMSYEAVLVFNAVMNSFSLPISAAATVFNDQKWTAMNLSFKTGSPMDSLKLIGNEFVANEYNNRNVPEGTRKGGEVNTIW
jgi:hypothetical protein